MSRVLLFIFIISNVACNTKVVEPFVEAVSSVSSKIVTSIDLKSNTSIDNPLMCSPGNRVVVRISLPNGEKFLCSDRSKLMENHQLGPICEQGPEINEIRTNSSIVDCSKMTLCGVTPVSKEVVGQRFDGGNIEEWTFDRLPWACQVDLRYALANSFNIEEAQRMQFQIVPPECRFCERLNKVTCAKCDELTATEEVISGQVTDDDCDGGSCSSCLMPDSGEEIPHKQGYTFYSTQKGGCGGNCNEMSMVRVCNDGQWEGDISYQYQSCFDTPCSCQLPGKDTIYPSGTEITLFKDVNPPCRVSCEDYTDKYVVRCLNGDWVEKDSFARIASTVFEDFQEMSCSPRVCDCPRNARPTILDGTADVNILDSLRSRAVYSSPTHSCGGSCEGDANLQGWVYCAVGNLEGKKVDAAGSELSSNPDWVDGGQYPYDFCGPPNCDCSITLAEGTPDEKTILILDGNTTPQVLHKAKTEASINDQGICNDTIEVYCRDKILKNSSGQVIDITSYQYDMCTPQNFGCMYKGQSISHDQEITISAKLSLECGETCDSKIIKCFDGMFYDGTVESSNQLTPAQVTGLESSHPEIGTCTIKNCKCDYNGTLYDHLGPDNGLDVYSNDTPGCAETCADYKMTISCDDSQWRNINDGNNVVDPIALGFTYNTCTEPNCHCLGTGDLDTINNGETKAVYSQDTYACGETESTFTGYVWCDRGTRKGVTSISDKTEVPAYLAYQYSSITPPDCRCFVETEDAGTVPVANTGNITLFEYSIETPSKPDACNEPQSQITLDCNDKVITPTDYDATKFKYKNCTNQNFNCNYLGVEIKNNKFKNISRTESVACGEFCDTKQIYCRDGILKIDGQVYTASQANFVYPYSSCQPQDCTCLANGFILNDTQSQYFYKNPTGTCDPNSCNEDGFRIEVTCNKGNLEGPDPTGFPYESCSPAPCNCALPFGGSLQQSKSTKVYKVDQATCDQPDLCSDPNQFKEITCSSGGVLTPFSELDYKYNSCVPADCTCNHASTDYNAGTEVFFYKVQELTGADERCSDNEMKFVCQPDFKWSNENVINDYPFTSCISPNDQGNFDGTGGGNGNDEGPGSALKKRMAEPDSGPGGGCFDATSCSTAGLKSGNFNKNNAVKRLSCELPWGGGAIGFYGSFIAFDTECVELPDKCNRHAQSRTCRTNGLTGNPAYKYNKCVEKVSCP